MDTQAVLIDVRTLQRAKALADDLGVSVQEVLKRAVEFLATARTTKVPDPKE